MRGNDRIVVVGAGLAGLRAAEALRARGFDRDLVIVGAERHRPYNRPPLSKRYLSAGLSQDELALPGTGALDARWVLGTRATSLDTVNRRVVLDGAAAEVAYDGLVIATGAAPRVPGGLPPACPSVHVLRSVDDAGALRSALATRPGHVLVIGAGFIGSEVASTSRLLGLDVTLVDVTPLPLAVQLGEQVAVWLAEQHRARGVRTLFGTPVVDLDAGSGKVRARLADGRTLTADLAVAGLGAAPDTDWLIGSGLHVADGVLTDAALFASGADDVVVAGDVARFPHPLAGEPVRVEHWSNAVDTARVAAGNLLSGRAAAAAFTAVPTFWTDQHGHKIQCVGLPHLGTESTVLEGSPRSGRFVVGLGRRGVLVGAVAVNSPRAVPALRRAVADRAPCSSDATGRRGSVPTSKGI